jgi:hypothetical protein
LRDGGNDSERRAQVGREAAAADTRNGDPFDVDAVRRDDARFDAPLCAEPHDGEITRAQRLRDGKAGKDVPAGAARDDHDGPAAHRT